MSELIGGLDEVGYGALAGPIISVVATFDATGLAGLPADVTDSKKTTEKQRAMLFSKIIAVAKEIGIGHAWPWEIDQLGVSWALQESYTRAIDELLVKPDLLIVDGSNRVKSWKGRQQVEPKADLNHRQVSAASMVAKHFRDEMMIEYAKRYPVYGWERNKGYGTPDHEAAIKMYGLVIDMGSKSGYLHRKRYCRNALMKGK